MTDLVSSCKHQIRSKFQCKLWIRISYNSLVDLQWQPHIPWDWGMRICRGRSFLCTCFNRITAGSRAQLRRTWVELSILWRNCIHGEDRGHHVGRRSYQKASMLTATRKRIISYFGEGNEAIAEAFKTQSPLQHCSILRSCTGDEVLPSQWQLWSDNCITLLVQSRVRIFEGQDTIPCILRIDGLCSRSMRRGLYIPTLLENHNRMCLQNTSKPLQFEQCTWVQRWRRIATSLLHLIREGRIFFMSYRKGVDFKSYKKANAQKLIEACRVPANSSRHLNPKPYKMTFEQLSELHVSFEIPASPESLGRWVSSQAVRTSHMVLWSTHGSDSNRGKWLAQFFLLLLDPHKKVWLFVHMSNLPFHPRRVCLGDLYSFGTSRPPPRLVARSPHTS